MRIEMHNLDGRGSKRTHVYEMDPSPDKFDFWLAVTDVPCPACNAGTIRWYEAGYVPGYRVCDGCKRHFLADGTAEAPKLLRVGSRKGLFPV